MIMRQQKNNNPQEKDKPQKKTVYKEKAERSNEKKPDSGETSSIAESGRTSLISKPDRKNKPLGSSHEPGTTPGQ